MNDRIRWGVMGNAAIAKVCVIPAIQGSSNGEVFALASRLPEKARKTADDNRISRVLKGYDALIAEPAIDAVYIPLPNHLHRPWTLKALAAGKHVLCEKPIAMDCAEAEEMADAAKKSGCLLMEGLMYRFHPRTIQIKRLLAEKRIGEPVFIRTAFCFRMPEEKFKDPENPRLSPQKGGGALLDVGCYGVSVARWIFNQEPVSACAQAVYHPGGVDTHFVGVLKFPGEKLATIEASFISALQQTYCVTATGGAVELPHDAFIPWEKEVSYTIRKAQEDTGVIRTVPGADEYRLMIEHFGDAVSGNSELLYPAADSVRNMKVLDALCRSAKIETTVRV